MKVGEGSLGSRVCEMGQRRPSIPGRRAGVVEIPPPTSRISLAFFCASFLRHRSTDAAAASSWNRSIMVVAVKSGTVSAISRAGSTSPLTPNGFLVPAEVLERRCTSLERFHAGMVSFDSSSYARRTSLMTMQEPSSSLGVVKLERLVAIGHTLLVLGRAKVGVACAAQH
jgi:hypothetical protein